MRPRSAGGGRTPARSARRAAPLAAQEADAPGQHRLLADAEQLLAGVVHGRKSAKTARIQGPAHRAGPRLAPGAWPAGRSSAWSSTPRARLGWRRRSGRGSAGGSRPSSGRTPARAGRAHDAGRQEVAPAVVDSDRRRAGAVARARGRGAGRRGVAVAGQVDHRQGRHERSRARIVGIRAAAGRPALVRGRVEGVRYDGRRRGDQRRAVAEVPDVGGGVARARGVSKRTVCRRSPPADANSKAATGPASRSRTTPPAQLRSRTSTSPSPSLSRPSSHCTVPSSLASDVATQPGSMRSISPSPSSSRPLRHAGGVAPPGRRGRRWRFHRAGQRPLDPEPAGVERGALGDDVRPGEDVHAVGA